MDIKAKPLKAFILSCTLKKSPEKSNTEAMAEKVMQQYKEYRIESELWRMSDYNVMPGNEKDMGKGDEWPLILQKILEADIFLIAAPIWMGRLSSFGQQAIERLDAFFHDKDLQNPDNGQYLTYNKVGGVLITGNEDGGHEVAAHVLWAMQELGFTVPPNSNAYWVGEAGAEKDYVEAGGLKSEYTNKTIRYTVQNTAFFAQLLRDNPIPTDFNEIEEQAKRESK